MKSVVDKADQTANDLDTRLPGLGSDTIKIFEELACALEWIILSNLQSALASLQI